MARLNKSAIRHFRTLGRIFGYPDCCVDFYIESYDDDRIERGLLVGPHRTLDQMIDIRLKLLDYVPEAVGLLTPEPKWVPCPQHRAHPPAGYTSDLIPDLIGDSPHPLDLSVSLRGRARL